MSRFTNLPNRLICGSINVLDQENTEGQRMGLSNLMYDAALKIEGLERALAKEDNKEASK